MKTIHAALLAAVSLVGFAGSVQAQTQTKYFARERLVPGPSDTAATQPPSTPPATGPADGIYNNDNSTALKNTKIVNGPYSDDASSSGFATNSAAMNWCLTIKVRYPNIQPGYMFCTIAKLADGTFQAAVSSSQNPATFTGGQIYTSGQGHWQMTARAAAYK